MAGIEELEKLGGIGGLEGKLGEYKPNAEWKIKGYPKVSADDEECQNEGVTDEGIINASKWKALLNGAILAYNVANSIRMVKLQRDIANKYLDLAKEQRAYYNTNYKPLEISLTNEALNLPLYKRNRDDLYRGQMIVTGKSKEVGAINKMLACTKRWCTGVRAQMATDYFLNQAVKSSLIAGQAHRYADAEEIAHNELRWKKRSQVMNIGRDIPVEAISYANLAYGIFGRVGEQAGKAGEGAMAVLAMKREPTIYPPERPPLQVSEYRYIPTPLEYWKVKAKPVYTEPPVTKVAG